MSQDETRVRTALNWLRSIMRISMEHCYEVYEPRKTGILTLPAMKHELCEHIV